MIDTRRMIMWQNVRGCCGFVAATVAAIAFIYGMIRIMDLCDDRARVRSHARSVVDRAVEVQLPIGVYEFDSGSDFHGRPIRAVIAVNDFGIFGTFTASGWNGVFGDDDDWVIPASMLRRVVQLPAEASKTRAEKPGETDRIARAIEPDADDVLGPS